MSEINKDNDAYEDLLRSFASTRIDGESQDEVTNHGEIYFSVNSHSAGSTASDASSGADETRPLTKSREASNGEIGSPRKKSSKSSPSAQGAKRTKTSKKIKKRNAAIRNSLIAVAVVAIVFVSALLIKIPIMGCINDILAIDVSNTDFRVVLERDMECGEVIEILKDKDLINNAMFCKLFAKIRGFEERVDSQNNVKKIVYPAGTYFLNSTMGIEGMLNEIRTNGVELNTIKLTFPEGYSVDQIVEKLDSNGVCSASSLYQAMASDELFEKYEFLSSVTEKELRYRVLEGYLYPDTYEFYIGESPISVVERFLNNFENKWSAAYQAKADQLGYTVDEIITVASILEKEAFDAEQMPVIASVIYNRISSSSFPFINCDSTAQYIENFKQTLEASGKYADYMKVYDTYQKTGLPVGAIGCPGADAIHAALHPASTNYYYFLHAKDGKMYLASTAEEHQKNLQYLE